MKGSVKWILLLSILHLISTISSDLEEYPKINEQRCSLDLSHNLASISVLQETQSFKYRRIIKRGINQITNNLRIHTYYDESFEFQSQAPLYKKYIIKPAIQYLESALQVKNPYYNIKLQRKCLTNRLAFVKINSVFLYYCADGCAPVTMCGDVVVPKDHLMACRKVENTKLVKDGYEGRGIFDTDFILYIESKNSKKCDDPSVLAYASSCQSEAELDRPIAGSINFCPGRLSSEFGHLSQSLFIAKHELIHALGFAVTQFAFYRDYRTGEPLTPRNQYTGRPDLGLLSTDFSSTEYNNELASSSTIYKWSSAVTQHKIQKWMSAAGLFLKNITIVVLPNVVNEARNYFNCSRLEGVELEDQGGLGVSLTHWEKRILENDIMTATFTQEARVSRITLALMHDTGWYIPNYNKADDMKWGRNLGCDFVEMSCYEYMKIQTQQHQSIRPFCNELLTGIHRRHQERELAGFCSEDRHAYGYCNVEKHGYPLPLQYRYFSQLDIPNAHYYGGKSVVANYCPYPQEFNWYKGSKVSRTTQCKEQRNNQGSRKNFLLQNFGPSSSCFSLSRRWTVNRCGKQSIPNIIGAGCYEHFCSRKYGLIVIVNKQSYQCPSAGDIVAIDDSNGYFYINGALICPSCLDLCPASSCRDNLKLIGSFINTQSILYRNQYEARVKFNSNNNSIASLDYSGDLKDFVPSKSLTSEFIPHNSPIVFCCSDFVKITVLCHFSLLICYLSHNMIIRLIL